MANTLRAKSFPGAHRTRPRTRLLAAVRTATFSFQHVLLATGDRMPSADLEETRLGKGPQAVPACCGWSVGKTAPSDDDTPRVPSPPPVRTVRVALSREVQWLRFPQS